MATIRTVRDLVLLWAPGAQGAYDNLAADLGAGYAAHMPRDWARRNSIPPQHVLPIVDAARRRGWAHVTAEMVLALMSNDDARARDAAEAANAREA